MHKAYLQSSPRKSFVKEDAMTQICIKPLTKYSMFVTFQTICKIDLFQQCSLWNGQFDLKKIGEPIH